MKFGQLIDYNLKKHFSWKIITKCGRETSPRLFSGKLKLSLDRKSKIFLQFHSSWGLSKYVETKLQTTCLYLILSVFKKQKNVWNYPPCLIFCIIFIEKYFSWYIQLIDQVSLSGCFYFMRYWVKCVL